MVVMRDPSSNGIALIDRDMIVAIREVVHLGVPTHRQVEGARIGCTWRTGRRPTDHIGGKKDNMTEVDRVRTGEREGRSITMVTETGLQRDTLVVAEAGMIGERISMVVIVRTRMIM